jgi:hypothetical protein
MSSRKTIQIPRNDAGVELAQQITAQEQALATRDDRKSKTADVRYREAVRKTQLRKAEAKIVREAAAVHNQERQMQYEASRQYRRSTLHSRTYNIDIAYERRQRRLNQMLVDDRLHARYSQPRAIKPPDILTHDEHG